MGEAIYRPLIEDMCWSHSRITCFQDCPYRFFLRYISGCEQTPQFYASYGKFMHKLLELYYKGEISQEEMQIKFLFDFQREVQGDRPAPSTVEKYIRQGIEYLREFRPLPFTPLEIEKRVEFTVGERPFVGIIDYLGKTEDGSLVLVDHKSRDMKPRSGKAKPTLSDMELDRMLLQLYLYCKPVFEEYGEFPEELCFNCFRTGILIREPFRDDAYREALAWAEKSVAEIEGEEEFSPYIEFFSCTQLCDMRDFCCYKFGG